MSAMGGQVVGAGEDGLALNERDFVEPGHRIDQGPIDPIGHGQRLPTASGRSTRRAEPAAAARARTMTIGSAPFR
jgi:hypothetical protein